MGLWSVGEVGWGADAMGQARGALVSGGSELKI